jgi:hypothetical protein
MSILETFRYTYGSLASKSEVDVFLFSVKITTVATYPDLNPNILNVPGDVILMSYVASTLAV